MSDTWNLRCDFGKQRKFTSKWVPLAGAKRKAPDDRLASDYDDIEPPSKQFAVDDEVAPDITKDGYLLCDTGFDGSSKPVQVLHEADMEEEEEESHSPTGVRTYPPRDNNSLFLSGDGSLKGKHGNIQEIGKLYNKHEQLGSLILSEELRATLARKRNDVSRVTEMTIPPSIMEQQYKNAMAVVLWKPQTDFSNLILYDNLDAEQPVTDNRNNTRQIEDDELQDLSSRLDYTQDLNDVEMEDEEL